MSQRELSWGAELRPGGARFRLWAPHEESVAVLDPETGRREPMRAEGDGWWSVETDLIAPGGGYLYALGSGAAVPDPVSREQIGDVHGPSRLIDPNAHEWRTTWSGRPWEEAVVYELHVGTFTERGDFDGVIGKLPHLVDVGVTAIELMPVAQFAGDRGWGYDGVLLYAPHRAYGGVAGLKRLVDAAHAHGLMVILDVVYNHFGPDGNYLHAYAPDFFDDSRHTPWGAAIAFERDPVRRFFVENPLYWLREYRIDGFRFDAIDQIDDQSEEPILKEMARAIRADFPHAHTMTEDDRNIVELHERDGEGRPALFTAEWNDDFHHVAHVAATGETVGYYEDYARGHTEMIARALATGFVYQGEESRHWKGRRGVGSGHLPPTAMVNFIQNHDQIGNRAFGERLADLTERRALVCLKAILLLAPQIPLIFMGDEWGETGSFVFFCDFHGELADAVREGRRNEFAYWPGFADPEMRKHIPDPNDPASFACSRPNWEHATGEGAGHLALVRRLLEIRRAEIVPRLEGVGGDCGEARVFDEAGAFAVSWRMGDRARLRLTANIDADARRAEAPAGRSLFETEEGLRDRLEKGEPLPGWSAVWTIGT